MVQIAGQAKLFGQLRAQIAPSSTHTKFIAPKPIEAYKAWESLKPPWENIEEL